MEGQPGPSAKAGRGGRRPGGGGCGRGARPRVLRSGGARREKKSGGLALARSPRCCSHSGKTRHTQVRVRSSSFVSACRRHHSKGPPGAHRDPARARTWASVCVHGAGARFGRNAPGEKDRRRRRPPPRPASLGTGRPAAPRALGACACRGGHACPPLHTTHAHPPLPIPSISPTHTHTHARGAAVSLLLLPPTTLHHGEHAGPGLEPGHPVQAPPGRQGGPDAGGACVGEGREVEEEREGRRIRRGRGPPRAARAPPPPPHLSLTRPLFSLSLFQALQAALRAGQVEAVKKFGGANKAHGAAGATKDAAKLDRETEELSHERYGGREQRERERGKQGGARPARPPARPRPRPRSPHLPHPPPLHPPPSLTASRPT